MKILLVSCLTIAGLLTACNPQLDWVDPSDDQIWWVPKEVEGTQIAFGNKRTYCVYGIFDGVNSKGKFFKLLPGQCEQVSDGSVHDYLISRLIPLSKDLNTPKAQAEARLQLDTLKKQGIKVE